VLAAKLLPKTGALKWFADCGEEKSRSCLKGMLVINENRFFPYLFKQKVLDKLVWCLINSHFQKDNLRTRFFLGQTPKTSKIEHLWYLKYT